jgi:hypothetical protein
MRALILAATILSAGSHGLAGAVERQPSASSQPFAVSTVHLEQNATDGDFEVVFEVKGGAEGLTRLTVVAPDGRTVVDVAAPDSSTLGVRQLASNRPNRANSRS